MDILAILRTRILQKFPHIGLEELNLRLELAHDLIKHIRK